MEWTGEMEAGLYHHLHYNHFPPLYGMEPVAKWAVERAVAAVWLIGEDYVEWDEEIMEERMDMPDGVLFRDGSSISVAEALHSMHLTDAVLAMAEPPDGGEEDDA